MKTQKRYVYLDEQEAKIMVKALVNLRNELIDQNIDHSEVNSLMLKVIDAPNKKLKVITEVSQ